MSKTTINWQIRGGDLDGVEGEECEAYRDEFIYAPWWITVAKEINCYSITDIDELHEYVRACGGELIHDDAALLVDDGGAA